jgi:hypothetical protein
MNWNKGYGQRMDETNQQAEIEEEGMDAKV